MEADEQRIRVKRIYRAGRNSDGKRILVDRFWPRGMAKSRARLDEWFRDIAPSDELRRWLHADRERWPEFTKRYFAELEEHGETIEQLLSMARDGPVTLLFASADTERNNAVALREYLMRRLGQ